MCLKHVTKRIKTVKGQSGIGYKIVKRSRSKLHDYIGLFRSACAMRTNKWMSADKSRTLRTDDCSGKTYSCGFHIFTKLEDAKEALAYKRRWGSDPSRTYVLVEVKYTRGRTIGIDTTVGVYAECIVAEGMKVLRQIKHRTRKSR